MALASVVKFPLFQISCPSLTGLIMILSLTGCQNHQEFVPVHGIVTLDRKPLAGANVVFEPIASPPQKGQATLSYPAFAVTDEQGKFQLYNPIEKKAGVIVGRHRIRVMASEKKTYSDAQKQKARQALTKRDQKDGVPARDITDQEILDFLEESAPLRPKEKLLSRYNSHSTLEIEITAGDIKEHLIELSSE